MEFKGISSCTGWYYRGETEEGKRVLFRVAAWALTPSGEPIGLIPAHEARTREGIASLVLPPPTLKNATYIAEDELNDDE